MNNKLQQKLKNLPELPGIYIFFDKSGNVLYVGKARSLKNRVRTYFMKSTSPSPRIEHMRNEIADLKYFITNSEVDALILECNFIKKYHPPYNIDYRDDKSYPFIKITREPFPSISLVRIPPSSNMNIEHRTQDYFLFGPYPKVKIVKEAIRKLRSIFPLRSCQRKIREDKITPVCLDYDIGLCAGPCAHKIEKNEYHRFVRELILLLRGEKRGLIRNLRHKMNKFSRELKFEEAAKIRNQLLGLEEIMGIGNGRSYSAASSGRVDSANKSSKLDHYSNGRVDSAGIVQGFSFANDRRQPLHELQSALDLPTIPVYIEGLDISNIGGDFATGSVVVFKNGVPYKNGYRHFSIKTVKGINDFQMLAEIARRHYGSGRVYSANKSSRGTRQGGSDHYSSGRVYSASISPPLPDLILVDGGIGQLNAVSSVLEELKLKIPVISLAKRFEEVFEKKDGKIRKLLLPFTSPALHLLQHIRDEAHRFAIKYHKILREKEIKKSLLDEVHGIGEKRKQKLLKFFGSVEKIKESNIEELKKLGIPSKIAQQILSM